MADEPAKIMRLSWSVILGVFAVEAAALAVLIGGAGLVWGLSQTKPENAMSDIKAELTKQVEAWNRGDLDGFMAGYWKSDKLTFYSGGDATEGWQTTRDRYRKRYQAEGKAMGQLTFSDIDVVMMAADSGYVRGKWKLDMPDGTKPAGLFTLIVKRIDNQWRVVHDHTSVKP
jgi:beta-aspartyl-peptidase (threonine type)